MGHGRIDETMLYVHVAASRQRPLPPELTAASTPEDPDRRILHLLGLRATVKWNQTPDRRGIPVASEGSGEIGKNEKGPNLRGVRA
jgi:hypothetical protein